LKFKYHNMADYWDIEDFLAEGELIAVEFGITCK
jgi:hypothetical protein